jgi:indolepyruvate ferredoxin oxidoreductase beta subunit
MKSCDIVLAGVGGQGVLLFAEILGEAAVQEGLNVRVSEVHGMAQRGGAVVSDVRIGEKSLAPTILEGTADVIVGMEPLEALRNIKYASPKTLVLLNTMMIKPSGIPQDAVYPSLEAILEKIKIFTNSIITVDAAGVAKSLGNVNVQNVVMLGALAAAGKLPVTLETIRSSIRAAVSARFVEINLKAFEAGYNKVSGGR